MCYTSYNQKVLLLSATAISLLARPVLAQPGAAIQASAAPPAIPSVSSQPRADAAAVPIRMARFSYVVGDVTWRADANLDWSAAALNVPLRQDAQVYVAAGGRAELQFDDGSCLRLGSGAMATLQVLFSDADGQFTQISLNSGLANLNIRYNSTVYQVDTPLVSVKAAGPARIRIGISNGVEVGVLQGSASVDGAKGKGTMTRGDYLDLADDTSPYALHDLPAADAWEKWNDERDSMLDAAAEALERHEVPANIALAAGNLDMYGTWQTDPQYGHVWYPTIGNPMWRPYFAGRWLWLNRIGWTWVSDEPWGWAPYHYGAWFHSIHGWAWRPGRVNQAWSPAVVHFAEENANISWCAFSPPELDVPVTGAVGQLAPINARAAAGATLASRAAFGGRGPFTPLTAGSTAIFQHGQVSATLPSGKKLLFDPAGVSHTSQLLTLPHSDPELTASIATALARPVYRPAALDSSAQVRTAASSAGSQPDTNKRPDGSLPVASTQTSPARAGSSASASRTAAAARAALPPVDRMSSIGITAVRGIGQSGGTGYISGKSVPASSSAGSPGTSGYTGGKPGGTSAPPVPASSGGFSGGRAGGPAAPSGGSATGGSASPTGGGSRGPAPAPAGGYHVNGSGSGGTVRH